MEIAEIREMSIEDIQEELDESREELMRLRFQQTTGELTPGNGTLVFQRIPSPLAPSQLSGTSV